MVHPLIAVVGSLDTTRQYEPPLRDPQVARQACEQLGRDLALQDCDIVVYSSEPGFVEADIVRGYVASGRARPGSIQIRSPLGAANTQFLEIKQHRELFDVRADASLDWEVSYYRSLVETQGILLVGGGRSTLATGLIALAFDIPIVAVAVAAFGGSAQKVWAALDRVRNEATPEDVSAMAESWHDDLSSRLVAAVAAQGQRKAAKADAVKRQQLATTPNTLDGSGARRLLFFVLPLGFIAGLTFDAVYAKLRSVDVTQTNVIKSQ